MSFFKAGRPEFDWRAATVQRSVHRTPGCAQCGTRLEMDGRGKFPMSGKCGNCAQRGMDYSEDFDEAEY